MGLFSRKPGAPPPAKPSAPPPLPKSDDPLLPLLGMAVDQAAYADGTLTLTFSGPAGEAHLEAYGRLVLKAQGQVNNPGTAAFDAALRLAPRRKVVGALVRVGEDLTVEVEGGLSAVMSLRAGDYPGAEAVYLKGPGRSYVNFNENGVARLSM